MTTAFLPSASTFEGGLRRYMEEIRRFPMLPQDEEYMLSKRFLEHGDRAAAHRLVTSHLRLVAKAAMSYRGYGLPVGDVISEGNVGLMTAVSKFDPDKGFRLSTYAMWWVRASIQEYILKSWSLVKLGTTANQKKLFFNLRRMKSRIGALEEGDLLPEHVAQIAKTLGVQHDDVVSMNRRLGGDSSLDAPMRTDSPDGGSRIDYIVDEGASQEEILVEQDEIRRRRDMLHGAMDVLNERERRIFEARRLSDVPLTLEDLAGEFGVSRERIRQIEVRAFEKVQRKVIEAANDSMRPKLLSEVEEPALLEAA